MFSGAPFPSVQAEDMSEMNRQSASPLHEIIRDLKRKNVVTAAASAGTHPVTLMDNLRSDPWDSSEEQLQTLVEDDSTAGFLVDAVCTCHGLNRRSIMSSGSRERRRLSWDVRYRQRRNSLGYSSPTRQTSGNLSADSQGEQSFDEAGSECPECGKPYSTDALNIHRMSRSETPALSAIHNPRSSRRMTMNNWLDKPRIERLEAPRHAEALLEVTPQLRIISQASTDMDVSDASNTTKMFGFILPGVNQDVSSTPDLSPPRASSIQKKSTVVSDYRDSLKRDRSNQLAAEELTSLLWTCAHEMSLEDFGIVESETFTSIFALIHSVDCMDRRMAGITGLDALIDAPSADEERKAIKFANTLSGGLRSAHGNFEFLSAISKALGHMARKNVDFIESEITLALEWLRTERSDRRLAATLALKEFAIHAPTAFYSKTSQLTLGQGGSNEFLDYIFQAIRDPQPIVRACAADALTECLKILMDRQHTSLTGLLCQVHFTVMEGLETAPPKNPGWTSSLADKAEALQHGSMLVVATMIAVTGDFMLPRFDEVCRRVMEFMSHPKALMRLEVVRLLPRLARRCPKVFARRCLARSLDFLLECASATPPQRIGVDARPSAFTSLGWLVLAMVDQDTGEVIGGANVPTLTILDDPDQPGETLLVELCESGAIYEKLDDIFHLISEGLKGQASGTSESSSSMHVAAFHCAADLVEGLGSMSHPYLPNLIDDMFEAGLSNDLIHCLHAIAESVPEHQSVIEDRLFQEVSIILAGITSARDLCDPLSSTNCIGRSSFAPKQEFRVDDKDFTKTAKSNSNIKASNSAEEMLVIQINMSTSTQSVKSLVLSLQTLGTFGDALGRVTTSDSVVPILSFVQYVAAPYLSHPLTDVRKAAALTCCILLVPSGLSHRKMVGGLSAAIIEEVLAKLLQVAVSDPSPAVRLCIVKALDSRYDPILCQAHHLESLFLVLQDDALATRAAVIRLLGRLASFNPAPILPFIRNYLRQILVELQCGLDIGRGREEATRMLVVFLKAKSFKRLIHPVLPSLVNALPLNGSTPRLASAALEALGELAKASGASLHPWVKDVVPNILETLQDQSSSSKQRTSLRTLGQIAGSTGYVIQPYIDYPKLLSQATDILPGTKRAPWSLRREVIRTLGVLGAVDPDRYRAIAPPGRKGGAVGGAYFVVQDDSIGDRDSFKSSSVELLSDFTGVAAISGSNKNLGSTSATAITTAYFSSLVGAKPMGSYHTMSKTTNHFSNLGKKFADSDDDLPAHLSMYEQYAMVAQPASNHTPARRMTPSDEEFYPTVTIQALMRIFKNQSLTVHHGMVMQAIMFIFKSLGLRSVPFLSQVVPHIMITIKTCGPSNLRESLLKQVATLSGIVREHLRPYVADIFDIVEQFWSSRHLSTLLSLTNHVAVGVSDEFKRFLPRLIRLYLISLEELQTGDYPTPALPVPRGQSLRESERLRLILCSLRSLRGVLGDFLHVLVPVLLKLVDSLLPIKCEQISIEGDLVTKEEMLSLCVLIIQICSTLLECEGTTDNTNKNTVPLWREKNIYSGSLSARAIQPLLRLLQQTCQTNTPVGCSVVEAICVCARQVGYSTWSRVYNQVARGCVLSWCTYSENAVSINTVQNITERRKILLEYYDNVIQDLKKSPLQRSYMEPYSLQFGHTLPPPQRLDSMLTIGMERSALMDNAHNFDNVGHHSSRVKVNQAQLQRAWDASQCASREDWDEWMRRLGIQLFREAPSPALRASAGLAHAYQPLSRELFSAAFVCCWKELSEPYRINLVHALEEAFVADISPEILQALLNLAEFMEHDPSGGLPIDITTLANLALKCRAYAKALHYKEREYNRGRSTSCVEALISINRKLDLQEAALEILKSATMRFDDQEVDDDATVGTESTAGIQRQTPHEMYYSVVWSTKDRSGDKMDSLNLAENKERWLAKLGSWSDALQVSEEMLSRNPNDFDATLGCMRCLSSSGEWGRVLELAEDNWMIICGGSTDVSSISQATVAASREQKKALRMCAEASWRLARWDDLEKYSSELVHGQQSATFGIFRSQNANLPRDGNYAWVDFEGAFYSAVLHVHRAEWQMAAEAIDAARKAMDGRFTALMAESYNRAYPSMVTAQTLAELEEIIDYLKAEKTFQVGALRHSAMGQEISESREHLLSVWRDRLAGCRVDAEVHSSIMAVRSLILEPTDEVDATLTLSELSREAQRFRLAERVLLDPLEKLGCDLNGTVFGFGLAESLGLRTDLENAIAQTPARQIIDELVIDDCNSYLPKYEETHRQCSMQIVAQAGGVERLLIQHQLYFAFLKHLWHTDRRDDAICRLKKLCDIVDLTSHCEYLEGNPLRSSCWLELGEWQIEENITPSSFLPERMQIEVLLNFKRAALMDGGYKAWHNWALLNFRIAQQLNKVDDPRGKKQRRSPVSQSQRDHVVIAVKAFVNAISLGTKRWSASVQQDMLNFLTCLFQYGDQSAIADTINECVESVPIETWLGVLPQLLARIHMKSPAIRSVLHPLLVRLGEKHAQALMYPLSVLLKSPVVERKSAAESLMNSLRSHSSALVEEALMVSSELIRVAILWLETWQEGLDEAPRLYFGEGNVSGMLDLLIPLHENLEKGPETRREADFVKAFGPDLAQANIHLKDYVRLINERGDSIPTSNQTGRTHGRQNEEAETAMNKAWDIYYTVFRRVNKQLPALTKLELSDCSPALSRARSLELGIPGSYRVDGSYVKIERFIPNVQVITSKQRPRKITLRGSDGNDYVFLLKGHEDLRQDERVMQLFGLVNALLERDRQTKKHDLRIQRYAVSPLSHNAGLVGWVPHTDTLHSLICDYRQTKRVPLNLEHREMLRIAPDYDQLTVMQKVEVFTEALRNSTGDGNDLYEILWLKSTNSEQWLERRTRYTRSLAVMSMVGYILGLGDRHPSNLMLDKLSGRVLHIDFGDCFEVAMNREKFPERVPFRLTRMLIKAMEVSGIEGSYRSTCERTMSVLRESRDSLVAMLEAFLYDPLISWRLVDFSTDVRNPDTLPSINPTSHANLHSDFGFENEIGAVDADPGVPIDVGIRGEVLPISEGDENDEGDDANVNLLVELGEQLPSVAARRPRALAVSASRARSLQMYSNIQTWAANLGVDDRITSISGGEGNCNGPGAVSSSIARSRLAERSMRQRQLLSLLETEQGLAAEDSLNERALKVIRRVQDKLNGTDFEDRAETEEPLDVVNQVQRLIVQATSTENLSQLYIGWSAFW
ncbi:phosphatidylinositol 3- and 4-kinase [Nitzschia inconspicua]|uniref:non-specific serine/threonine protein kinase n=1 Tax=Nitzschia inconspicua TaxID=303405 RepID=A0A9K3KES5_9STRA|nr:phosphatidylinositol 3- and 4-kinase [Nitzschia inconspicua]